AIVDQFGISAAIHTVFAGIMEVPLKLLRDHFDRIGSGRSVVEPQLSPNTLPHHCESDEDHRSDNRPDHFQPVATARVNRAITRLSRIAILPHHPAETDLGGGKGNTNN